MGDFILALDEGTSSARAVLFDREMERVGVAQQPIESLFPNPGWVEQDAEEIWRTQSQVVLDVLATTGKSGSDIHAIGITNQRETTLIWDRSTAQPIAPAIVWQCRRTADFCEELKRSPFANRIQKLTGLVVDAYFSASKIAWILDHVPDAQARAEAGDLLFGTIDSWLIYKLTGGKTHVIDRTNASRTMLMDLALGQWSTELLEHFQIPTSLLPEIVDSSGICGYTNGDILGVEIPIAGIAGDQQAALVGQGCLSAGQAKNTYGTGCFLLMHTGTDVPTSQNQLLATAAAGIADCKAPFALEGSVFDAGTVVQWMRDELGLLQSAEESEKQANSVPDTNGVRVLPAFSGLGAPHWRPNVQGAITGITRNVNKAHIIRAGLESIAFQTADLVEAMQADGNCELQELNVDGGACHNDFLLQFQADIIGMPVNRPTSIETTVRGAALLAGLATDMYAEVESLKVSRVFEPSMSADERIQRREDWTSFVQSVIQLSED